MTNTLSELVWNLNRKRSIEAGFAVDVAKVNAATVAKLVKELDEAIFAATASQVQA